MNANDNQLNDCRKNLTLAGAALASCQKLIAQFEQVKTRLGEEFGAQLAGHESLLKLVLNEAEALAWDTSCPQLVFATLAAEKPTATLAGLMAQGAWRSASIPEKYLHPNLQAARRVTRG